MSIILSNMVEDRFPLKSLRMNFKLEKHLSTLTWKNILIYQISNVKLEYVNIIKKM